MAPRNTPAGQRAFTLLELVTVVLVVAILGVMLAPVYQQALIRAARSKCMENLRGLHVAANLYMGDHHAWPQISNAGVAQTVVATKWIARLQPYGVQQINWICPTIQQLKGNPDLNNTQNVRIDYTSTPFDSNPQTPYRWARQPWFVENGNMHGNGNLIVFPDGHIEQMNDLLAGQGSASPSSH
jgi:prepilin-type N-terminal cleavage/methylation domain-containing protein